MKVRHQGLIIGQAALFAATIGCEAQDGDQTNQDAAPNIPRDMSTSTADGQASDAAPSVDMRTAGDANIEAMDQGQLPDVSPMMDMAITEIDQGASPADAVAPPDATHVLDADIVVDAAPMIDAAPVVDAAPPVPDMEAPGRCQQLVGQACRRPDDGCCDNNEVILVCRDQRYVPPGPNEIACGCEMPNGPTQVFCAVPGFVGIAQAGRLRRSARHLRSLTT